MQIHELRTKADSNAKLKTMFGHATKIGEKTKVSSMRTEHGLKDNMLESYMGRIWATLRKVHGSRDVKQNAVDALVHSFPPEVTSAVWRIKGMATAHFEVHIVKTSPGLDPHSDTPVEILHVVLLGFVKYFWRDAINRLNDTSKAILETRLSSLNVQGLGIPSLNGRTLVRYAGSLTGRDFRVIAQVAPFVLYDLVPVECFNAWLSLSSMIPLIWQPVIKDVNEHLVCTV